MLGPIRGVWVIRALPFWMDKSTFEFTDSWGNRNWLLHTHELSLICAGSVSPCDALCHVTAQKDTLTGCQRHTFRLHELNFKVSVLFSKYQLWYQLQEQRQGEKMGYSILFNLPRRPQSSRLWSFLPCIKPGAINQWPTDVFCLAHHTVARIALQTNEQKQN